MSDLEIFKVASNTGGLALALYVVYLIVRLMLGHLDTRNKAADETALRTIDVVAKHTEAVGHLGQGLEAIAASQAEIAKALVHVVEIVKSLK